MVGKTNCLEIKIRRYFGDCPSNCLKYMLDQTLVQCSEGGVLPFSARCIVEVRAAHGCYSPGYQELSICASGFVLCLPLRYGRTGCGSSICSLLAHAARLCLPCKKMSH